VSRPWPVTLIEIAGETRRIVFCWSTFDAWPELWEWVEERRRQREAMRIFSVTGR
jgi:hypothetical protein